MYMYALTCESPPQSVVLNFLSVHDPCSPFLHGLSDLHQLLPHTHTHGSYKLACISYTVEPLNKGHLGIHRQLSFIRRLSLIGRFVSKHTLLQHQYFIFSVYSYRRFCRAPWCYPDALWPGKMQWLCRLVDSASANGYSDTLDMNHILWFYTVTIKSLRFTPSTALLYIITNKKQSINKILCWVYIHNEKCAIGSMHRSTVLRGKHSKHSTILHVIHEQ